MEHTFFSTGTSSSTVSNMFATSVKYKKYKLHKDKKHMLYNKINVNFKHILKNLVKITSSLWWKNSASLYATKFLKM